MFIIEDGSGSFIHANSFVTDAEYTTYAASKGLTVSATQALRMIDLFEGVDYILQNESNLQGYRSNSTQAMPYPRIGVSLYGYTLASDKIPQELKNAQMEAAAYATSGTLLSNSTNNNVKSTKVDVLSTEYFSGGKRIMIDLQRVNVQLKPLLKDNDTLVRT